MRVTKARVILLHGPDIETTRFLRAQLARMTDDARSLPTRGGRCDGKRKMEFRLDMGCVRTGQARA